VLVVGALVIGLAAVFSSPDEKSLTVKAWAQATPDDFVATAASELAGTSVSESELGRPYNSTGGNQTLGPLEESVRATVASWGYEVRTRIGSAGYRIDLGVLRPGSTSFLLGIECDGAMYHGCPVARDRDRLRPAVLAGLGWDLHRIWGAAWYRDRAEEEARLRDALKRAELPARRSDPLYIPPVTVKVSY